MHLRVRRYLIIAALALLIASCGGPATSNPAAQATPALTTMPPPIATAEFAPASPAEPLPTRPPAAAATLLPAPTALPGPSTTPPTPPALATADSGAGQAPPFTRPLQLQDPHLEGKDVEAAQRRLIDLGYAQVGDVDGNYGPNTAAAVRTFQTLNELAADGILGPRTWERLFSSAATRGSVVAAVVDSDARWLLGSTYAEHWLDGPTTATLLRGNEHYRLYSLTGAVGAATGNKPVPLDFGPCENTFEVDLAPRPPISGTIALGGDWNALPRSSVEEDPATSEYRQAIADLLRAHGIADPDVRLTKVVRSDLVADGTDEVLITATRHVGAGALQSASVAAGDYSLVVLRAMIDGAEKTVPIIEEYYTEAQEFAAPNEYTLVALLDLNGDGQMEIVITSAYYEGAATSVYSVAGGQVQELLSAGCGA